MSGNNLEKQLTQFGFTLQQARLYLAGLSLGKSLMAPLARVARVKRSTAYYGMEELLRRKFFSVYKIGKRVYYSAASPQQLVRLTEGRLRFVKKIYPRLQTIQRSQKSVVDFSKIKRGGVPIARVLRHLR